jgi:hypothetical protein
LSFQQDWGNLDLFVLTGFRENARAGKDGRFRLPLTVDQDKTEFEAGNDEYHMDFSIRYNNTFDDWDMGVYYFIGTDRESRFHLNERGDQFVAIYDQMQQFGTDIQYTYDAWLLKFEGIYRDARYDQFFALVSGFEYTYYQVNESAIDVGLLVEYLYDGRDFDLQDRNQKVAPTSSENDFFIGTRISWNDVNNSNIIAGALIDLDDQSTLFSVEYEQRLDDFWSVEVKGRWFHQIDKENTLYLFQQDSHILFNLIRYF